MSNHPKDLNIYDSAGPPAGILPSKDMENDDDSTMLSIVQDIPTFGIAGRIWDSSYALDIFLRRPSDQYTFMPSCPIPRDYFLNPLKARGSAASNCNTVIDSLKQPPLDPIKIIELGAGTGYVGIALAKRLNPSCTLILTDLEEVIPLLEKNVHDNIPSSMAHGNTDSTFSVPNPSTTLSTSSSPISVSAAMPQQPCAVVQIEPLAWGNSSHAAKILSRGRVDYVVASDLVYFPELYPPLLQTLREITDLETRVIFGYKERAIWKEMPFWEQFGRFFEIDVVQTEMKNRDSCDLQQYEEEQREESVQILGAEEEMYVFVAKKRRDEDILDGVDDTLATLMMMQIRY
ncbi:putative methyltransferase-domain-containing protein [Gamsiella multidivaricata]|uniref:putative methyltransferase-domain-containing protein n=1 Tax=Gamsiella multidivaricata TaxID=101098 RepID=UPI00221E9E82|nr:putative methyltransferase-domain-containing protein [Gamsiella multidivaricata]KAG0363180.1 hypothetical protein BGZ54_008285 [Gamsiella multidivaricata]KAI7819675.1 putative methyltransferase-domain-containing protein [Gamsiella multidivaricata]